MSYANNDHWKWVESSYKIKCSDLGKEVANILGFVGRGIYNAPFNTKKVDWTNNQWIEANWEQSMANFDGRQLTELVIECHRRMIRVSVQPCSPRHMKLMFWQRQSRTGDMSHRLPDIEEMIKIQDAEWGRDK